jgi:glutaredoxin
VSLEVILYTRIHCGLCEEAADALRELEPELGFTLVERDIDADPALLRLYDERVPVVTVGGREVAAAPIDRAALRRRLAEVLTAPQSPS